MIRRVIVLLQSVYSVKWLIISKHFTIKWSIFKTIIEKCVYCTGFSILLPNYRRSLRLWPSFDHFSNTQVLYCAILTPLDLIRTANWEFVVFCQPENAKFEKLWRSFGLDSAKYRDNINHSRPPFSFDSGYWTKRTSNAKHTHYKIHL